MSKLSENSDSDTDSDATLEEQDLHCPQCDFGHPLERVPRSGLSDDDEYDPSISGQAFFQEFYGIISCASSSSDFSTTSSVIPDIDFEELVDALLMEEPAIAEDESLTVVEPSSKDANDSIIIKCLPRNSSELLLLLELNHPDIRSDPWNPTPHILCAVERGDNVFLCMQRLIEFDRPSFKTVANYIDFFRQSLEGLTFLHEHKVAQLCCSDPRSLMVDLGICPSAVTQFDRALYPVRYYYVNFSEARRFHSSDVRPFRQDVQDFGEMIDRMLTDIPRVGPKLKSLVKAMASGEFGADDARKLLDALCKSLESSAFDTVVPAPALTNSDI